MYLLDRGRNLHNVRPKYAFWNPLLYLLVMLRVSTVISCLLIRRRWLWLHVRFQERLRIRVVGVRENKG